MHQITQTIQLKASPANIHDPPQYIHEAITTNSLTVIQMLI